MDKKVGKKEILLLLIIFAAAVIGYFVLQKLRTGKSDGGWNGVWYL